MHCDIVGEEMLGEASGSLVRDIVVGEIDMKERIVEGNSGHEEFEEIVVDAVGRKLESELRLFWGKY